MVLRIRGQGPSWVSVLWMVLAMSCWKGSWAWESNLQCPEGWDGPDCSIPYETCADEKRKCYNGSVCVMNNMRDKVTGEYGYHCDCRAIESTVSAYAGEECEHASTQICSFGSLQSFCTNGGTCLQFVAKDEKHVGCDCPEDYSGAHCQFVKGSTKTNDDVLLRDVGGGKRVYGDKRLNTPNSHKAILATTIVTIIIAGSFIAMLGYFLYRKRIYQSYQDDIQRYEHDVSFEQNNFYEKNQRPHNTFQIDDDNDML